MATSIGCLGENELGRGNLDQAEALLKQALTQMQDLGMTWHIAETNWDLAQLYHAKGNPTAAQQHYTLAKPLPGESPINCSRNSARRRKLRS
jgi:Tfp pilus assembly protein PilF